MKEIWKPVRGKEDWAEISNLGQIHYYAGKSRRYPDEHWTYGSGKADGYLRATIGGVNKGVHIWVFMTFNDCDIPKGMEVNHLDEDKHNNCVWNLNLMTPKDNSNWGTRNTRITTKLKGKPKSPEHVAKVSAAHRGMKQSEETKAKISAANRGKPKPKVAAALSKAVQALDKITGEVVYEFPSTTEAQRQGFKQSAVSQCCNGKRRTHKGFIWRHIL